MQATLIIEQTDLIEIIRTHLKEKTKIDLHVVSIDFKLPSQQDQDNGHTQVAAEVTIDLGTD